MRPGHILGAILGFFIIGLIDGLLASDNGKILISIWVIVVCLLIILSITTRGIKIKKRHGSR